MADQARKSTDQAQDVIEPDARLVLAVVALGMIAGTLIASPAEPLPGTATGDNHVAKPLESSAPVSEHECLNR